MVEVRNAVFSVHDDKRPRPDDLNAKFIKLHLEGIKYDLLSAITNIFQAGKLPKGINHTFISLIPKVDRLNTITEYRSISCCNMYYKVLSKVLCNRLKHFLPHLISKNQTAFIKVRYIGENILLAHELLLDFNKKRVDKFCIKVDL